MISLLAIFVAFQTYHLTLGVNCPDGSLTPSCSCYVEHCQGRIHVQCANLTSPDSLSQQIRVFNNIPIGSIRIFDPQITALPDNLFQDICVKEIQIFRGRMKKLSDVNTPFPNGQITGCLNSLGVFMGYDINLWDWNKFMALDQLKVLKILSTPVNFLPKGFAKIANGNLQNISLCFASINNIEDGAFSTFENLLELRLSSNELNVFQRTLLPATARQLELLDLKKNSLTNLQPDMFSNMPKLIKVDISYNRIETLPEEIFKPVWNQMQILNINGNPLKCDCKLTWLITAMTSKILTNDFDKAACATPANLAGRTILSLKETDLTC